jgi:hypothetical protein
MELHSVKAFSKLKAIVVKDKEVVPDTIMKRAGLA